MKIKIHYHLVYYGNTNTKPRAAQYRVRTLHNSLGVGGLAGIHFHGKS